MTDENASPCNILTTFYWKYNTSNFIYIYFYIYIRDVYPLKTIIRIRDNRHDSCHKTSAIAGSSKLQTHSWGEERLSVRGYSKESSVVFPYKLAIDLDLEGACDYIYVWVRICVYAWHVRSYLVMRASLRLSKCGGPRLNLSSWNIIGPYTRWKYFQTDIYMVKFTRPSTSRYVCFDVTRCEDQCNAHYCSIALKKQF